MIALKPGYMVALATKIDPPPTYRKTNEATDHASAVEVRSWEAEVTVQLPEEYDRAKKVRGRARSLMTGACIVTPFHVLMCPTDRVGQLDAAEAEARRIVEEFNASATFYRVDLQTFRGTVEEDSTRAAQAVGEEVRSLLDSMERSIRLGDVKAARDAAVQAKSISRLLEGAEAEKVSLAVRSLRQLAREVVDKVQGQAEELLEVVTEERLRPIAAARMVFLDPEQVAAEVPSPAASREEIGAYLDAMQAGFEAGPVGSEEFAEAAAPHTAPLFDFDPLDQQEGPEEEPEPDREILEEIRREASARLGIPFQSDIEQPAPESLAAAQTLMNRFRPVAVEED